MPRAPVRLQVLEARTSLPQSMSDIAMANVQQRYRCACVRACVTTQNQVYVFTSFDGNVGSLDITAYPSGLVVPISPSITDGYAGVLQYVAHVARLACSFDSEVLT